MKIFAVFSLIFLIACPPAWADLYRCDSGRGTYVYTNSPCVDEKIPEVRQQQRDGILVDPDTLRRSPPVTAQPMTQPSAVSSAAVASAPPTPEVSAIDAMNARKEIISASLPLALQAGNNEQAQVFAFREYLPGMSWLIRNEGQLQSYERYEITAVDEHRIHWRRTLLNASQQPFAGGISEDFVLDRDDKPVLQSPVVELRAAGFILECQKQQLDQAVLYHVASLPLIIPFAQYRSGDTSTLIEFQAPTE